MQLPQGFQFSGVTAGIKESGTPDMALIVADQACVAAGVYTQNIVHAASIDWNRAITPTAEFRGLIINSGNANACTGAEGASDNQTMAQETARCMGANENQVAVLSTGIIGHRLPMDKVVPGIEQAHAELGNTDLHFQSAATAILTTDKGIKTARSCLEIDGSAVHISAMAKGAGMIGPNMATMLSVVTTDANLDPETAQSMLQRVADRSFNNISVEGHTSTNDAMLLLASGQSTSSPLSGQNLDSFEDELTRICVELAKQIPSDGEGASHLIEIQVAGAKSNEDANRIARAIAQSNLVKCAITGSDPNWGRIVSAAGYSGADFDASAITLTLNGHELYRDGTPTEFDDATVSHSIGDNFETTIRLVVGDGPGQSTHWTSDLTVDYVRFNSEYTT